MKEFILYSMFALIILAEFYIFEAYYFKAEKKNKNTNKELEDKNIYEE